MPPTSKARDGAKPNLGPKAGPGNRLALIEAAREVFHDEGFAAPLSAVARRAGVGQGSLYRHFPDRMSLAVAVFDENVSELEQLAARPDSTLDDLFDAVAQQAIGSTAIIEMLAHEPRDERATHLGTRVAAVADAMRRRAEASGRIGPHIDTEDVMLAISMLAFALAQTPEELREQVAARSRALFHGAFAPQPGADEH